MAADETYDPERARKLVEMLRALADRIRELDRQGDLLGESSALLRAMGDIRSELFRYEVSEFAGAYFDESDAALDRVSKQVAQQLVTSILENF